MKNISIFFGLLLLMALNANADTVAKDKVEDYKRAVKLALDAQSWDCTRTTTLEDMIGVIDSTGSIQIDESGSQPLLIFQKTSSGYREMVYVTTSADLNAIISIRSLSQIEVDVNSGNLKTPVMGRGYKDHRSASCL